MKIIINLIVIGVIVGGAVYFYEQNRDQLNQTLDQVKNASVESVTEAVVDKVKNMDTEELLKLAADNKELLVEMIENNDINLQNTDLNEIKAKLAESGISLDSIDLNDPAVKDQIKKVIESANK